MTFSRAIILCEHFFRADVFGGELSIMLLLLIEIKFFDQFIKNFWLF